jgi:hypothetical protein
MFAASSSCVSAEKTAPSLCRCKIPLRSSGASTTAVGGAQQAMIPSPIAAQWL